jgi:hypothetical protein
LEKTEIFHSEAKCKFLKNGQEIADIIGRLNIFKDPQNWLSMQPNPRRFWVIPTEEFEGEVIMGEINEDNIPQGRVIHMWGFNGWSMMIGYENNYERTGGSINIVFDNNRKACFSASL